AISADQTAFGDTRRSGYRVRSAFGRRLDFPNPSPLFRIDGDEPAIQRTDVHAIVIKGRPAIDHIAAHELGVILGNFRIVGPELASRSRIDSVYDAPRTGRVEHAISHQGRRLQSAQGR